MPTMSMRAAGRALGVTALLAGMAAVLVALAVSPMAAQRPVPLPVESGKPVGPRTPMAMVVGAPPVGVTVTGTPAQAQVAWKPTPGVSGYSVLRWKQADPNCCRAQSAVLPASATSWDDLVQWSGTWIYRVTAIYPNNAPGFVDVSYLYPEPQIPAGFKAVQTGEGIVTLSWQPVPNASYYVVGGPPTNQAMRVNGTSTTVTGVQPGKQSWQLGSTYDPDGVHRAGSAFTSTSLDVVRRSGRYRLTVETIRVEKQSFDWDGDGHGDEVYVSAHVQMVNRQNGALGQSATLRSVIHGEGAEYGAWAAPARVARGSATNMGGFKTGDVSPVVGQMQAGGWPEFVLWEGLLTDGVDQIIVAPMLWESDDQQTAFKQWNFTLAQAIPFILGNPAVVAEAAATGLNPVVGWEFTYPMPWKNMDRPLGISRFEAGERPLIFLDPVLTLTAARQWVVVLTREKIEATLAATTTFGGREPGVIAITMTDVSYDWNLPQDVIGGSYTLYLRVTRLP